MQGYDAVAFLPTGGKMFIFWAIALLYIYLFNGDPANESSTGPADPGYFLPVVIIISPLRNLMADQLEHFNRITQNYPDLVAANLSPACSQQVYEDVRSGHRFCILYMSDSTDSKALGSINYRHCLLRTRTCLLYTSPSPRD